MDWDAVAFGGWSWPGTWDERAFCGWSWPTLPSPSYSLFTKDLIVVVGDGISFL